MKENTILNPRYIWLPVIIGVGVVLFMFFQDFQATTFEDIHFNTRMLVGILLAVLFMLCQNIGLMWRFKLMGGKALSWKQAFRVNLLCEFTSAATPSSVGGSSLIVLYLHKEGIKAGKGTAIMISCLFLDEFFLCLACSVALLCFPLDVLFGQVSVFTSGMKILFAVIGTAVAVWTCMLYLALFHRAVWVKKLLLAVFSVPFLRKWKESIRLMADDLIVSADEMKRRSFSFWLKCFLVTMWAWCSRYWVVNALLFAFAAAGNQFLAFARQLVIWMVMMVSPTPGGSGLGEYMFKEYYSDFLPTAGVTIIVALVWRIITYYSYLIGGALLLPYWLNRKKYDYENGNAS